jgi:GDPmannose 4,6-dehydratase
MKTALITGVTGQDGFYLSKLLLEKDYKVYGMRRRTSQHHAVPDGVEVVSGDITDQASVFRVIKETNPDEVYNLAAATHVGDSFNEPRLYWDTNAVGCLNVLEAIRQLSEGIWDIKFYQASTSELFGDSPDPQAEATPLAPRSPYATSKLAAYWTTIQYREAYGIDTWNGILFNHESPLRGNDFVTKKICNGVKDIAAGRADHIALGNLKAKRDWGHAADYVRAMWLMMNEGEPGEYVVATGETHSVEEFLAEAFAWAKLEDWRRYITTDPRFMRPLEVPVLRGDATKIRALGWEPEYDFHALVRDMMK